MKETQENKVGQQTVENISMLKSQKPTLILGAFLLLIIGFFMWMARISIGWRYC